MVLIALDGADWEMIHELTGRNELPHVADLIRHGSSGVLHTVEPMLSPMLWTSLATGKAPPDHGVLDFFSTDDRGRRIPVPSNRRRAKALWNIAGESGHRVAFVGWQVSFPAERVHGVIVTDRISGVRRVAGSSREGVTFPEDLVNDLEPLIVATDEVPDRLLRRFFADAGREETPFLEEMETILAHTETFRRVALELLNDDVDVFGVYFPGIDEVSHLFARYMAPPLPGIPAEESRRFGHVLEEFYRYQDEIVGELLAAADPEASVYVVSDHGFQLGDARPYLEPSAKGTPYAPQWHRDNGVIIVRGPRVAPGRRLERATIFDVAPTILAQLGIPVGRDMAGSPLDGMWNAETSRPRAPRIPTHDRPGWRDEVFVARPVSEDEPLVARELAERLRTLGYIGPAETPHEPRGSAAEHANLAGYYMLQGQPGRALEEASMATGIDPGHYAAWRHQASIHRMMGRLDKAIPSLKTAIALRPRAVEPRLLLADIYGEAGLPEVALLTAEELARNHPDDFRVHNKLGELMALAGRDEPALDAFRRSLALHPRQEAGLVGVFSILLSKDEHQEVEKLLDDDAAAREDAATRWLALGKAHFRLERFSEAAEALKNSLERDPDNKVCHLYLGILFGKQGRREESLSEFDRALRIDPDYAEAHFNKGVTFLRAGAHRDSLGPLARAAALRPHSEPILSHLGKAHLMGGETERAREALEKALLINPNSPMARRYMAQLASASESPAGDREPM